MSALPRPTKPLLTSGGNMNLRKLFSNKSDAELVNIHRDAEHLKSVAERGYRRQGAIEVSLAEQVSGAVEVGLVARAIGKSRLLTGGTESHKRFHGTKLEPTAKDVDAEWGRSLRERRGF